MALRLEQSLKLSQQLVMTPQLQMAIKLLQMTRMELTETVRLEMESNPTIEEISIQEMTTKQAEKELTRDEPTINKADPPEPQSGEINKIVEDSFIKELSESEKGDGQIDWQTYFEKYMDGPSDYAPSMAGDEEKPGFEHFLSSSESLFDYMMWQVRFSKIKSDMQPVAEEIAGNINEDGYLKDITLEEIAEQYEAPIEKVERVHRAIMQFEPYGLGARDLQECLLAQARYLSPDKILVSQIIRDYWEFVEKRRPEKIARLAGVSQEEVIAALQTIKNLNPRPGAQLSDESPEYIVPDVYVQKLGDDYHIMLNEDGLPKLRLSQYYQRALADKNSPAETRDYIKGKLRSASWLIRSIQQRQRTIYKVAESIINQQREFLSNGVEYLKPMVLRDVADDIEMHESTISRVTTNKYMHTPQGIFELKYFFNSGITNSNGHDVASTSIKSRIVHLIEQENTKKPLSDQKIVDLLKQEGIDVARRTVAKYRESMNILPSSKRRQAF